MPATIELLGKDADSLLKHTCTTVPKQSLHLPGPDVVERIYAPSDRNPRVLNNLQRLFGHGRLADTGYMSILPVDQGIEHSAGASFAPNPEYFDPENIVKLAIEGGCNAVASTFGVLGIVARKYAHKIPFIVKINHNELLTYPNKFDQIMFGTVEQAYDMGAAAVGATIYFGSDEATRQIVEVSPGVRPGPRAGHGDRPLVLPAQQRLQGRQGLPRLGRPDRPGQPPGRHDPGRHHQAEAAREQRRLQRRSSSARRRRWSTQKLTTDHPIDLCRYQVANCYMGRCGLINSGGASSGAGDLAEAVRTAVINKRAGGMGLISGRKAFQRPMNEGVELLNAIQDVYLDPKDHDRLTPDDKHAPGFRVGRRSLQRGRLRADRGEHVRRSRRFSRRDRLDEPARGGTRRGRIAVGAVDGTGARRPSDGRPRPRLEHLVVDAGRAYVFRAAAPGCDGATDEPLAPAVAHRWAGHLRGDRKALSRAGARKSNGRTTSSSAAGRFVGFSSRRPPANSHASSWASA